MYLHDQILQPASFELPITPYPSLKLSDFKKTTGGKETGLFFLENRNGMRCAITNYGARLISLSVPIYNGKSIDVVAGFDSLDAYLKSSDIYHGAIIGRFCNRINAGKFSLDNKIYKITKNEPPNSLHGGSCGFNNQVWDVFFVADNIVELSYLSPDMEEGYPGNLQVKVIYMLTDENALKISYEATTDKTTILNLTNHAYFNLNGIGSGSILNHRMNIRADFYLPINSNMIPTGQKKNVTKTPFDFRKAYHIGSRINDHDDQLRLCNGYNHNYVLNKHSFKTHVASVTGDLSGIMMQLYTDQPGLQFYTANHMKGDNMMRGGKPDKPLHYFALETQHFPDSPNQQTFPSTTLLPGQIFLSTTIYKFS